MMYKLVASVLLLSSVGAGAHQAAFSVTPQSDFNPIYSKSDSSSKPSIVRRASDQLAKEVLGLRMDTQHNIAALHGKGPIREVSPVSMQTLLRESSHSGSEATSKTEASSEPEIEACAGIGEYGAKYNFSTQILTPTAKWGFTNVTICSDRPSHPKFGFAPTIEAESGGTGTPFNVIVYVRNYANPGDTSRIFDLNKTNSDLKSFCYYGHTLDNSEGVPICTTFTCASDDDDCLLKFYVQYAEVRVIEENKTSETEIFENMAPMNGISWVSFALLAALNWH